MTASNDARRKEALARLGVQPYALRTLSPISAQLGLLMKQMKKHKLPADPYFYLKCVPGTGVAKLLELYYGMPAHLRKIPPIEAYCFAAHIPPVELLDLITKAIGMVSRQLSGVLANATHPRVVEKTVEMALTDEGIDDRMALHKATGFIPTPSGPRTTVNVAASASAAAAPVIVAAPSTDAVVRRLADRLNEHRPAALPPASSDERPSTRDLVAAPDFDDPDEESD